MFSEDKIMSAYRKWYNKIVGQRRNDRYVNSSAQIFLLIYLALTPANKYVKEKTNKSEDR